MVTKQIIITTTGTLADPGDWDPTNNKIELVSRGGGGGVYMGGGGAGGGGAYAIATNAALSFPIMISETATQLNFGNVCWAAHGSSGVGVNGGAGSTSFYPAGFRGGNGSAGYPDTPLNGGGGGVGGPLGVGANGQLWSGGRSNGVAGNTNYPGAEYMALQPVGDLKVMNGFMAFSNPQAPFFGDGQQGEYYTSPTNWLILITYEPKVAAPAALVMIVA